MSLKTQNDLEFNFFKSFKGVLGPADEKNYLRYCRKWILQRVVIIYMIKNIGKTIVRCQKMI